MSEWHPIETAKLKDSGSLAPVDLWAKRWMAQEDKFEFKRFADCVWSGAHNLWQGVDAGWCATHWMVPPEPPDE